MAKTWQQMDDATYLRVRWALSTAFTLFACFLFYLLVMPELREASAWRGWGRAKVEAASIEASKDEGLRIAYRYAWQGVEHRGSVVPSGRELAAWQRGAEAGCLVNPLNPVESRLFWSPPVRDVLLLLLGVLAGNGVVFVILSACWLQGRRVLPWFMVFALGNLAVAWEFYTRLKGRPLDVVAAADALPLGVLFIPVLVLLIPACVLGVIKHKPTRSNLGYLFFAVYLGFVLGIASAVFSPFFRARMQAAWPEAEASSLTAKRSHGFFSYSWEGKTWFAFDEEGVPGKGALRCRVNPDDPTEAVFLRRLNLGGLFFPGCVLMLMVAACMTFFPLFLGDERMKKELERVGFAQIDTVPGAVMAIVAGIAYEAFFLWFFFALRALPAAVLPKGGVPVAVLLILVPGFFIIGGGCFWLWCQWPRRRVVLERTTGRFLSGILVFPQGIGDCASAKLMLTGSNPNAIGVPTFELAHPCDRLFSNGEEQRLPFTFERPERFRDGLKWRLTLDLGKNEDYAWEVKI